MSDKYVQEQRWSGEAKNELAVQERIANQRGRGPLSREISKLQFIILAVVAIPSVLSAAIILYRDFSAGRFWHWVSLGLFIAIIAVHAYYRSPRLSIDESLRLAEDLEKQKRDKR
jgi:hypothetical protein